MPDRHALTPRGVARPAPSRLRVAVLTLLVVLLASVCSAAPASTLPTAAGDLLTGVTLTGSPTIGGTLSAVATPPFDPTGAVRYRFVWRDGDVELTSYHGPTLYLNWVQYGSTLTLTVIATGPDGSEQSATSQPVGPIFSVGAQSGVKLSSTSAEVTATGTPPVSTSTVATRHGDVAIERAWLRDGAPITTAAQTETHVFERADSGHRLSFRLTARQQASGLSGSIASASTPVVGTFTPPPVRLTPATTVKQLDNVEIDLPLLFAPPSIYPPVVADCFWTPTWFRDGQVIPNLTTQYKQALASEGGARITASLRIRCTSSAPVVLAPVTKTASNTVTVSGRPTTWTPWNNDRLRDVIVRRSQQKHYQAFYGLRSAGRPEIFYAEDLPEFDGMTRVVVGGDLDADGVGDALAQTSTGDLYVYAVGGLTSRRLWKVGSGWGGMNVVLLAGDLDSNHVGDILARRASDGALLLYSSTGARVLPGRVVGTGFRTATKIAVSPDATGDSIPDLYATWPDGTLRLYAGRGTGGFRPGVVVGWSGWSSITHLTDGGDANLDGKGDLYAVDNRNHTWVYYGNGNGKVGPRAEIAYGWYFTAFR